MMKFWFCKSLSPSRILALLSLSVLSFSTPVFAENQSNSHPLFTQATQEIATHQYDEAEKLYLQALETDTDSALAALGRLYILTNQNNKAKVFQEQLLKNEKKWSDFARARGLSSLGENEQAAKILSNSDEIKEQNKQAVLLLARLYSRMDQDSTSQDLLLSSIQETNNPDDKYIFALALLKPMQSELWSDPEKASIALDAYIDDADHSRHEVIDILDQHIISLQLRKDYFNLRKEYLSLGKEKQAGSAWFATRLLVREQDPQTALAYLSPLEEKLFKQKGWSLLAQEKMELLVALGQKETARSLAKTLNSKSNANQTPDLIIKEAQIAAASNDNDTAISLLQKISPQSLEESNRNNYYILLFTLYSRKGDIAKIIDLYPGAVNSSRRDSIKNFHRIIFANILQTEQHWEMADKARQVATDSPGENDVLWLLAAEAAMQARQLPNELEALYQYAKLRPDDLYGIKQLAMKATPLAVELKQAAPEMLATPEGEPERVALLAEESLTRWIELTPYDPKPIIVLMGLYTVLDRKDEAPQLAINLWNSSGSLRVAQNIAYVLARNGYPEQALVIYNKLIKENPEDTQTKMNRAACLTRLNRTEEAEEFYKNLLINGYKGKEFHSHELIDRLWKMAQSQGNVEELQTWFDSLSEKQNEPLKYITLSDLGALYAKEQMPQETEKTLRKLLASCQTEQNRHQAWHKMATTWSTAKDFEKAINLFEEGEADLSDNPEIVCEFQQARAEILHLSGKPDEAISLFKQVSITFDSDPYAWLGLFRAAEISEEINQKEQAKGLYQKFLKTPSTDFPRRHLAEQKIVEL